jgi:hypothetical protein
MIESGRLPMADICSTQFPLSRFQDGLDLVSDSQKSAKVTLLPD